jgi:DNA-binding CsgD family transcriptional regulator
MRVAQGTVAVGHNVADTSGPAVAQAHVAAPIPTANLVLDRNGHVIATCASADRLLASGQPMRVRANRLCAMQPDEDLRLQTAIAGALSTEQTVSTVLTTSPTCSLRAAVSPLRSRMRAAVVSSCLVRLEMVTALRAPSDDMLARVLGLSPAQARVAAGLLNGATIRNVAVELHVSVNTCKTHIKAIYAKTGCRSQVELVRRLMQLGAGAASTAAPDALVPGSATSCVAS